MWAAGSMFEVVANLAPLTLGLFRLYHAAVFAFVLTHRRCRPGLRLIAGAFVGFLPTLILCRGCFDAILARAPFDVALLTTAPMPPRFGVRLGRPPRFGPVAPARFLIRPNIPITDQLPCRCQCHDRSVASARKPSRTVPVRQQSPPSRPARRKNDVLYPLFSTRTQSSANISVCEHSHGTIWPSTQRISMCA